MNLLEIVKKIYDLQLSRYNNEKISTQIRELGNELHDLIQNRIESISILDFKEIDSETHLNAKGYIELIDFKRPPLNLEKQGYQILLELRYEELSREGSPSGELRTEAEPYIPVGTMEDSYEFSSLETTPNSSRPASRADVRSPIVMTPEVLKAPNFSARPAIHIPYSKEDSIQPKSGYVFKEDMESQISKLPPNEYADLIKRQELNLISILNEEVQRVNYVLSLESFLVNNSFTKLPPDVRINSLIELHKIRKERDELYIRKMKETFALNLSGSLPQKPSIASGISAQNMMYNQQAPSASLPSTPESRFVPVRNYPQSAPVSPTNHETVSQPKPLIFSSSKNIPKSPVSDTSSKDASSSITSSINRSPRARGSITGSRGRGRGSRGRISSRGKR